jgi:FlaA1/EpsC-like NDP-sugar epimerase
MPPSSFPARQSIAHRLGWRPLASFGDLLVFSVSALLAFELRFDGALPPKYHHALWISLGAWVATKTCTFTAGAVNRGRWQKVSLYDAQRIAIANTAGSVLAGLAIVGLLGPRGLPRSLYALEWIISCFLVTGMRVAVRTVATARRTRWADGEGTKTLIYGAGTAGFQLLRELRENRSLRCEVVGFIDDDPRKLGLILDDKRVLGTGEALEGLAIKHAVERLFIAIPSATGAQLVRILNFAADADIEYKMVPSLGDLIQGKKLDGQIRNVAVEDLLGRKSVQLNQDHILNRIEGKVVMVTGAGGSIGSELCRQIARFRPLALIGFDAAETPLFQIDCELRKTVPNLLFHPEIGSVTNPEDLNCVMQRYNPSILYHAAAYKHVPMMERHTFAAVENNIFGTWQTANAAMKHGVNDFVLISTDKAVRPTSVMGVTKRVAELVIRSLQSQSETRFVAVRFGNVLGSNGSVVPIFKEQIAAGGPVTVTHPEMRRYFMTIPEAAQLVLQAFSIGKGGDVFLLDMGQPVKIADLARNLILLSGLKPGKDIKIEFTGRRPGEKLFEELNLQNESLLPTQHAKIRRYKSPSNLEIATLEKNLGELRHIADVRDVARLVQLLKSLVPDYTPGREVLEKAAFSPSSARNSKVAEAALQAEVAMLREHSRLSGLAPASENS